MWKIKQYRCTWCDKNGPFNFVALQ